MLKLNTALDSQLQRDSDLTHFDYLCLAMLSEEPDWTHVDERARRRGPTPRCRGSRT